MIVLFTDNIFLNIAEDVNRYASYDGSDPQRKKYFASGTSSLIPDNGHPPSEDDSNYSHI